MLGDILLSFGLLECAVQKNLVSGWIRDHSEDCLSQNRRVLCCTILCGLIYHVAESHKSRTQIEFMLFSNIVHEECNQFLMLLKQDVGTPTPMTRQIVVAPEELLDVTVIFDGASCSHRTENTCFICVSASRFTIPGGSIALMHDSQSSTNSAGK